MKILFPDALDPFPLPASREEKNSAEQDARLRSDDVWYVLQELEKRVGSILSTDSTSLTGRISALEIAIASGSITTTSTGSVSSDVGLGSASQVFGMDSGGVGYEWKTLVEGSNISIVHGAGTITISASLAGGGYATIQEEGTPLTQRVALNFIGPFTAADDAGNARTNVTLTAYALTKSDDTNVTMTLGGTPASALLVAASMTLGWTGTLSATRGGTGQDSHLWTGYPRLASAGVWSTQAYLDAVQYLAIVEGTLATNIPMIDASVTWNAAGVTFSGWRMLVTDTASVTASLLLDLQVGGTPKFSVRKDGTITVGSWGASTLTGAAGGTGIANVGKSITLGGDFSTSGAFACILTLTATTNVTLPTSGTLVNSAVTTLSSLASIGTITTGIWNAGAITSTGAIISTLAAGNALIIDTSVLVADATNNRVGVNDATPTVDLSVNGQLNCFGGLSSSFTNTVVGAGGVIVAGSVCQVLIMKRGVTNIGSTTAGDKFAWYTDGTGFKLWTYATDLLYVTPTGTLQTTGGVLSSSASAGVGYAAGAGGTQSQSSSKSTGVTLNKVCGTITMNGAALAADTTVAFTLTNSSIAATDEVVVVHSSVGTLGAYTFAVTPASGSAVISVHNCTPGSLSEAIVIRFFVLKAVTS